jgi:small subunit ribosomal protein S6
MRPYELVVLLHPDLEIDADAPIAKLEKLVDTAGGNITKRDNWGKRRLAYQINHQDFAVYVYFELQFPPANVPGFEHGISLAEEVIRHLLVGKEEEKKAAKTSKVKARAGKVAEEPAEEASDGEKL